MRCRTVVALVACVALVASCGGRVSREQVAAEAAEDGFAFGGGVAGGAAPPGSGQQSGGAGSAVSGTGGAGSGAASNVTTGSGAVAGGGGPAPTASGDGTGGPVPLEGGNGGATDIGVTEDRIILGNVSTLSGPVPGLFRGALVGTQAWAAMINSQGGINGRLIEIRSGDDGLDSGKNKAAVLALKDQVFGFLGSFSVTDDGGASELAGTNIPDIGYPLATARANLPNNFSAIPAEVGWESGPAHYYRATFGDAVVQNTAFFVSSVESARVVARRQRSVLEQNGYRITYTREVQPNEPNYTGDVIQMRSQGVQNVVWEGQVDQIANLVNTMHDQGFTPPLLTLGATTYSNQFLELAAEAAEGGRIDLTTAMYLGQDAGIPEVALLNEWMAQVDPGQDVDLFAVYAWANARLLEQALREIGPNVTRDAVLASIANIHSFDANGLIAPADPGARQATDCFLIVRVQGGEFVREHPASGFECNMGGFQPTDS